MFSGKISVFYTLTQLYQQAGTAMFSCSFSIVFLLTILNEQENKLTLGRNLLQYLRTIVNNFRIRQ